MDVVNRIQQARIAFNSLRKIWTASQFTQKTKIKLFKINVMSVLLYGEVTWTESKQNIGKIQTFNNKFLRYIIDIFLPKKITNEKLWQIAEIERIKTIIKKRKW